MKNLSSRSKGTFFFLFLILTLSPLSYFFVTKNVLFYTAIQGNSMEPSFHDGDKVLVWKVPRFIDRIADGDVILFEEYVGTNHTGRIDIKRVKAIPGEYIQFHRNGVNITKLGIDEYYVLGDNADVSYDSRFFGPIHRKQIIGVVVK